MFFKAIGGILGGNFGHISVAGNFGNDGGGGDLFDKGISFFEQGDLGFEWGVLEEIDSAVNDNFGKRGFSGKNLFDGAAGG